MRHLLHNTVATNSRTIKRVGWFDEGFTEIGGEDDDYHVRLILAGIELKRYNIDRIHNFKPNLKVNSYGKKVIQEKHGYSNANTEYLWDKWEIRNEPFLDAFYIPKSQGSYWKLRTKK